VKLGIFLPNWIGDVAMATPALRALRRHFGQQSRIVGIMRPYVADVLVGTPFLDDRIFFNPRSADRNLKGWRFLRALRRERFDIAVLLTNSLRTAFWAWASGAPERIGYTRDLRSWFLTHKLYAPMAGGEYAPQSTLDAYLKIAYALGCPAESPRMELATTPADEQAADEVWRRLEIPDDRPVVALNSGAAFGASKLWPTEYFATLARRIALDFGHTVLVICGPREREIAHQIATAAADARVLSLADPRLGPDFPLPIGLSKACVRRATLLVTTDSGPRHFAAAFDVPVITLFGPTHISLSETHFAKAIHLQKRVPCGPCMQTVCPLGHHQCMRDLSVDEVYQAVQSQLAGEPSLPTHWLATGWSGTRDAKRASVPSLDALPWQASGVSTVEVAKRPPLAQTALPTTDCDTDQPVASAAAAERASGTEVLTLPRPVPGAALVWVQDRHKAAFARAGLDSFADFMASTDGRLLRALPDRENWRLEIHPAHSAPHGMFLKKHHERGLSHWVRANVLRATPATPGRDEAEIAARLAKAGIPAMSVVAFGERLHRSGLLESFAISEELAGYTQLDDYLIDRFPAWNSPASTRPSRDRDLDRLLRPVAEVAGRFHRQGYNHRDLYCCHFFIREAHSGEFDVRLIDLQRVQHRTRLRRRWIVKDLAQLAYSTPHDRVSCSRKLAFFKAYLGVDKLRPEDKRLARRVLRKQWLMQLKMGPYR
jgi:heptosyltransferase-2